LSELIQEIAATITSGLKIEETIQDKLGRFLQESDKDSLMK
jgi:hypothetical protein